MKLKLKQTIVADRQYVAPAVIEADAIGLSEAEAQDLIARGVAELATDEPAPAEQPAPAPRATRTRK